MQVKITRKRRPELHGHKVKRTGPVYYDVAYWSGNHWSYREFTSMKLAKEFTAQFTA